MQSENIAFVYLCLDSDEDEWKEMLQKEDLKGQHYLIKKKQLDRLREEAGARGRCVPHYMIIDKNGKVISNNGPKPSSGKVEEILMNL